MDARDSANELETTPDVIVTGTAKSGGAGPAIGLFDIGVNEQAYFFRVVLPGMRRNESNLKCEIEHDGTVHIEGVVAAIDARLLKDSSKVLRMRLQQLSRPGAFTISFRLPGPVDPRLFSAKFREDGILEATLLSSSEAHELPMKIGPRGFPRTQSLCRL
ncbi:unnamed protein product [Dovyalis caffra]|uniref:SHSP domain-containing protein n=1 Tax=Dovyalis caffra TaxID=77055 RepID=A0AAV1S669_9ROSI|nr:unnamed protein product [Dovyalis caffra]